MSDEHDGSVAVVGMHGRFPGADDVAELWDLVGTGASAIRPLTPGELAAVEPTVRTHPGFVPVAAPLAGVEDWDPELFGFDQGEAEITDPQHRLFLECAWGALEDAGYDARAYPGVAGVIAGCGFPSYLQHNLARRPDVVAEAGFLRIGLANDRDTLTTSASYRMNLRGPSVVVQSACSTSLLAVHLACQSLLTFETDLMLAGAVTLHVPQTAGHLYEDGGLLSRDGRFRSLDAGATGRVFGSGGAVVALKRTSDALRDGDHVYATIVGSATNNDGSSRVGYAAPGVRGQAAAMVEAMASAGVPADTISYVEAHGTGTTLGDAVELEAIATALAGRARESGPCHIGTVKPNIGHLDHAAGVTGLIKTVLMLQHRTIPAQIELETPNPALDLASGSFAVASEPTAWHPRTGVRRALVNAFGLGGANAVVVVEEAPARPDRRPPAGADDSEAHLLVLSARSPAALDAAARRLRDHLLARPDLDLGDVAFTLQTGRTAFDHRRAVVCVDVAGAVAALDDSGPAPGGTDPLPARAGQVAVAAPGPAAGTDRVAGLVDVATRWVDGAEVQWPARAGAHRRRVPLPTYPLQRRRCWIDPAPTAGHPGTVGAGGGAVPLTGGVI